MTAGIYCGWDNSAGHVVTLDAGNNRIAINALTGTAMTIGATPLVSTNKTINEATEYTVTVVKRQGSITAWVDQDSASIVTYSNSTINEFDSFGLISEVVNAKLDDFKAWSGFPREQHGRRWRSSADTSLSTLNKELTVNGKDHGGVVVFTGHKDDDYIAEVDIARNSGLDGSIYVRYLDPDNWYRVRCTFPASAFNPSIQLESGKGVRLTYALQEGEQGGKKEVGK